MLDKRLVFVTGKGGVGKSTCSAALALAAARLGRRVLVVEMAHRPVMGDFLGGSGAEDSVGAEESGGAEGTQAGLVETMNLDAEGALADYLSEVILHRSIYAARRILNLLLRHKVVRSFWKAAPGISEMVLLSKVWNLCGRPGDSSVGDKGTGEWDLVIVDLPSSGHAVTLLRMPAIALRIFKVGPIYERARLMQGMLGDRDFTEMVVVAAPEELPVNETIETFHRAAQDLVIGRRHVIINRVEHLSLDGAEREAFTWVRQRLDGGGTELLNWMVSCGVTGLLREQLGQGQVDRLKRSIDASFIEVPLTITDGTPALVDAVSRRIEKDLAWAP